MSHVTQMNESWHTAGTLSRHIYDGNPIVCHDSFTCEVRYIASHMNESCHTWRFHVTRMSESCPTYECVLSHTWMTRYIVPAVWRSHGTQRLLKILFVTWHHCVPWLLHMCDAIYRTSCVKESWHTMCDVTSCQLCEGVMAHSVSLKHCVWRDTIVCHDSSAPTP